MSRPDIAWHVGATDETFGVQVWIARIQNLKAHFQIIRDNLPEDSHWLRNQISAGLASADSYIANAIPADDEPETPLSTPLPSGSIER